MSLASKALEEANPMNAGLSARIYPPAEISAIATALQEDGEDAAPGLQAIHLTSAALARPETLVSANQLLAFCRYAARTAPEPQFAYRAGLRVHLTAFRMYGLAILSCPTPRKAIDFALRYRLLAAPVTEIAFREEGRRAIWMISPPLHASVDAKLARFLVEFQMGILVSVHRDVNGATFVPIEVDFSHEQLDSSSSIKAIYGARVQYSQPQSRFVFDASWLDKAPVLGNQATFLALVALCNRMLRDLNLHTGVAGSIRRHLMASASRAPKLEGIAAELNMSGRTMRRKLREEKTSFRAVVDELRAHLAKRYLRDSRMTVEDIAEALGFSDAANFRRAFRRWTRRSPLAYRSGGT